MKRILLVLACLGAACGESTQPATMARVRFRVTSNVGPCVATLGVRFKVDGAAIGDDVFNINKAPARNESSEFFVTPGPHNIQIMVTGWDGSGPFTDNTDFFPDTIVTFVASDLFVHTNDLYCS